VTTDENFKIQGHDALTDGVTLVSGNDVANAYKSMEFAASQFDFVNGNVGIGGTPSTWLSAWTALHIGTTAAFAGLNGTPGVGGVNIVANNAYLDPAAGGTWKRITGTDYASLYQQYEGSHSFQYAASGVAGSAISWLTAMTITNGGLVGINCTPSSMLTVAGPIALNSPTSCSGDYHTTPYTVLSTDCTLMFTNSTGGTQKVTLPSTTTYPGRFIFITNQTSVDINSSASNILGPGGGTSAVICSQSGNAPNWCILQAISGGNWLIVARGI
jgi:hypothetical protein